MKRNQVLSLMLVCVLGVTLQLGVTVQAKPPWQRNISNFKVTISGDLAMDNPPYLTQSADDTYWVVDGYQGENIRFEISYVGYAEFHAESAELQELFEGELINVYSIGHAVDNLEGVGPRDTWIVLMTWEHGGENYYMTISSDWDADLPGEGEGSYDLGSDSWTINFRSDNTEITRITKEETYLATVCRGKSGNCVVVERTRTIVVWDGLTKGFLDINLVVQRVQSN